MPYLVGSVPFAFFGASISLDKNLFESNGINISWKEYSNYPEYKQRFDGFFHNVTILDLIFNTGPKSDFYVYNWREE